ncbi:MAG: TolC family protein [Dokdonella sp.]
MPASIADAPADRRRLVWRRWRAGLRLIAIASCAGLSACASYRPLPLRESPTAQQLGDVQVSEASMPVPALATHRFDPSDGLDVTEVAMLAVANNPDLRVLRGDLDIAQAQAFAAGLLPDPQLNAEKDRPTSQQPDLTSAFNLGLTYDLGNLLTRSARVGAARDSARAVHLSLLWSEWQTIARARQLFGKIGTLRAQVARLREEQAALAPLQPFIERALAAGDLTYDSASSGLRAATDVATKLADGERLLNQAEHDLHDLLGLDAKIPLHLVGAAYAVDRDTHDVTAALAELPDRRPDLRALEAGYAAQDGKLRAAILAQFPAITVGFVRARDTSNIYTSGLSVALALPLFDRNRGNIAIETATRQRLHDEYAARLLTSRSDVDRLLHDLRSYRGEHALLAHNADELAQARTTAERSYSAGLIDWPTYLAIRASALAADSDLATLEQNTHEQAIALDTLAGGDWPTSTESSRP